MVKDTQTGTCIYVPVCVCMHAEANSNQNVLFKEFYRHTLEENHKTLPQGPLSVTASGCLDVRLRLLFSSPIIITHISCRSLLQIFIESSSYGIHRTRRSYSESDGETGFSKEKERARERDIEGMKVSHIDKMKGNQTKIVNQPAGWVEFNGGAERKE